MRRKFHEIIELRKYKETLFQRLLMHDNHIKFPEKP